MSTPRFNLDTYQQGDDDWSHTDTVEFVDEHSIDRGPVSERPTSGNYDDEFYYATDQGLLWRWDQGITDWVTDSLGTSTEPVPGTSHFEAVSAEELDFGDAFQSPEQTPSVDNIETVIYEDFKYTIARFTVYGFDGDQIVAFVDEVIAFSGSGSSIEQTELGTRGTPDGRTYSSTGTELSLAMDAGDYAVTAMPMSLKRA